jgi:hypothetical protein
LAAQDRPLRLDRLRVGSRAAGPRVCLRPALPPCPGSTIARAGLPSCVTPSLAYCRVGSPARPVAGPKAGARVAGLASPGSAGASFRGYGNINPLSIDYACRPRLRSRLTLGGLTWPRNPWSFGGRVSHPAFATHACILTRVASTAGSPRRFARHTTLPYPPTPLNRRLSPAAGDNAWVPRLRRCA